MNENDIKASPLNSVQSFVEFLNELYQPENFRDYCPNGLQVDAPRPGKLQKVAFAVTASLEAITAATQWNADLLITHHGILWDYHGARAIAGAYGERVKLLIKNETSLVAYHLPMDGHPTLGHGAALAQILGLQDLQPLQDAKKNLLGVWGEFPKSVLPKQLKEKLTTLLSRQISSAIFDEKSPIKRVGIITGGGQSLWNLAHQKQCHAYVTGEMTEYNYHDCREAEIHYFAGGHHATEVWGLHALQDYLAKNFPEELEMKFFDSGNPA
ncbi:MAG: Nif3-like dinuclear metal center hexameric protein [Bacteriovoracaceae bacterium]|nr:Nif3-like dinuclear metal center hexameric protein [Bacteriovoracaceae bacterium]